MPEPPLDTDQPPPGGERNPDAIVVRVNLKELGGNNEYQHNLFHMPKS